MDDPEFNRLHQKIAELEEWLAAERGRREAVDEHLRDARDELRCQQAEVAEMQKVNGELRGRIARLESNPSPPAKRKRTRRPER
jgi:septal ring factor EnvC (AmiA/AmiB activator)